ncbi:MAG: 50S ribosomal protein L23 [Candidatus Gracilibacteria bacterium]
MDALYSLIKPVVTEKATELNAKLKYAFWVNRKATKIDIKRAIKEVYGADVDTVRIMNTPAKKRMARRMVVDKRPAMRKAIITLKGGKKLDVTKIGKEVKK